MRFCSFCEAGVLQTGRSRVLGHEIHGQDEPTCRIIDFEVWMTTTTTVVLQIPMVSSFLRPRVPVMKRSARCWRS